jgi:hypothetical protein
LSKTKKIDKEFLLTDSSVNSYGFRLLTSGYLMDEYKKNPIGYDMHKRDTGVLVRWEDLRVDGEKVYGKPVINLNHPNGQKTVEDIENGFINAASVGHLIALEVSEDPAVRLPNQLGPTVTKWFNRECSLVDIPGNFNALKLYDKDENEINLADFTKPKFPEMKKIEITAAHLTALNLKAEATDADFATALNDLVAKAAKVDSLQTELATAKKTLGDLNASVVTDKVKGLLAPALAAGKITKELSDKLEKDYATNPDGLSAVLSALPAFTPVTETFKVAEVNVKRVADLVAKGYDALMESGEIVELKAKSPDAYKQLFKDTFGVEPK